MPESTAKDQLQIVEAAMAAADVAVFEECLAASGLSGATWIRPEDERAVVRVFVNDLDEARAIRARLAAVLPDWLPLFTGAAPRLGLSSIAREDWAETWKAHFHTFHVSARLTVRPSWERYAPRPGEVVVQIDPGMCFGTGRHGTTRACLEFIDSLVDELGSVSLLDAGCGSGILALAAAALGYRPVAAFDNDRQAVDTAAENARIAGIAGIDFFCADLGLTAPRQPYRVVVANILAPVLIGCADALVAFLDHRQRPSYLVLSGILTDQYNAVRDCFLAQGFEEVRQRTIDEWTSGLFRRN